MDDKAFWQAIYTAVVRSGRGSDYALREADVALQHLKSKGFPEFPTAQVIKKSA